jgi:hypothetical protein
MPARAGQGSAAHEQDRRCDPQHQTKKPGLEIGRAFLLVAAIIAA